MRFLALLFLFLSTALALPGGGGPTTSGKGSPNRPEPPKPPNLSATHMCKHRMGFGKSNYKLYGYGWNLNDTTEGQMEKYLRFEINEAAAETKWTYSQFERDGKKGFNATFNLPLLSASRLEIRMNGLLSINVLKKRPDGTKLKGIKCPSKSKDFDNWD